MQDRWCSVEETAEILSFSKSWVRDRIKDGSLKRVVKIGNDLRIPRSAIDALMRQHEIPGITIAAEPASEAVGAAPGIAARSVGELVRRIREKEARAA